MNNAKLRTAFLDHVGAETFRRFAQQLRRDLTVNPASKQTVDRLRFWQSRIWEEFSTARPGTTSDIRKSRDSLLWCDVHDKRLSEGKAVRDRFGVTDRDGTTVNANFKKAFDSSFPFGFGFWTLICEECVEECAMWFSNEGMN